MKLMYITNQPEVARIAERYSVDRIFVDLEVRGKEERQKNRDTVKSQHSFADISAVRAVLDTAELLVRVNPLYEDSRAEVDEAIARGADVVMLPMFRTEDDAKHFVDLVGGRAKTLLLLETRDAENHLDAILDVDGVDEIHIGLNDLHLDYHLDFMFELLANGTVDRIAQKLRAAGRFFGFGGVAGLTEGQLPGKQVLAEHVRVGSQATILSRSFCDVAKCSNLAEVEEIFSKGISEIRGFEKTLAQKDAAYFEENHRAVVQAVAEIIQAKRERETGV